MTPIRGTTGMDRIVFSRKMTPAQGWALIEPARCAVQRLLDGVASVEDLGAVGASVNLAWLRCRTIGDSKEAMGVLEEGSLALLACENRGGPVYAIEPGAERDMLCDAINLYETILRASSLNQWRAAEEALVKTLRKSESAAA